jgi:hypothetical protein
VAIVEDYAVPHQVGLAEESPLLAPEIDRLPFDPSLVLSMLLPPKGDLRQAVLVGEAGAGAYKLD